MKVLTFFSYLVIPLFIFYIVALGFSRKRNVYEDFLEGAQDGLKLVFRLVPTLVGMLAATGILRASGFLDFVSGLLGRVTEKSDWHRSWSLWLFCAFFPTEPPRVLYWICLRSMEQILSLD